MTTNIEELRRLAQAAKNSCESVEWSHEFRGGRYSQGVIISGEENILIVCGANYGCWRDADDEGDSQFKALGDFVAAANPAAIVGILDRLEAAESALSNLGVTPDEARDGLARHKATLARLEAAEKERDALRARIAEMEQQEPVGTLHDDGCFVWRKTAPHESNYAGWKMALYALPGAKGEEK